LTARVLLWGSVCHHVKREASRFISSILILPRGHLDHAPLARTLIGELVGDTVTAQLPNGRKQFEILGANLLWARRRLGELTVVRSRSGHNGKDARLVE
jgi:hypothetical protein